MGNISAFPKRIAAFDFGSNSVKLGVFEAQAGGAPRCVLNLRDSVDVGNDAFERGSISYQTILEIEEAVRRLLKRRGIVDTTVAAATSAYRKASNGRDVVEHLSETLGSPIDLIDGGKEARLLGYGVLCERGWDESREAAVLDIGGGSMELIRAAAYSGLTFTSLPLGAIRLRADHDPPPYDQPYSRRSIGAMTSTVKKALRNLPPLPSGGVCYGSGGGFTTLGDMVYGHGNRTGVTIGIETIDEIIGILSELSAAAAAQRFSLPFRRARIMLAGAIVARQSIEKLGVKQIEVSWAGLRDGLVSPAFR